MVHRHKFFPIKIRRYTNMPSQGYVDWACECGAVKEVEIVEVEE